MKNKFSKFLLVIAVGFVCVGSQAATVTNVNVGGSANDHTGDPLRPAFIKLNNNDNLLQARINTNDATIADIQTKAAASNSLARVTSFNGLTNAVVLQVTNIATNIAASSFLLTTNGTNLLLKIFWGTGASGLGTTNVTISGISGDAITITNDSGSSEFIVMRTASGIVGHLYMAGIGSKIRMGEVEASTDYGTGIVKCETLQVGTTNILDLISAAATANFISTNIPVPTAYTVLTNTHTLGVLPTSYRAVLVNLTSEQGYAIGDEVALETVGNDGGNPPVCISWNASNFYLAMSGTSVSSWNIRKRGTSGGQNFNLTHDFWAIKIYASK